VAAGATVVLNAFFCGTEGDLSYQWKFQGNDIARATGATLVLQEAGITNAGVSRRVGRNYSEFFRLNPSDSIG
jgi:hypothetical protein